MSFQRMKKLTTDKNAVIEAIKDSSLVEVLFNHYIILDK